MAEKPRYDQQYCKKHNQRYAHYLHQCLICKGEELDGKMKVCINERIQASNNNKKRS
jgi:hypothetical protein